MPLPPSYLLHLQDEGYHPRSDKHSKALAKAIVMDLMDYCPRIAEEAKAGRLVFQHNHDLTYGHSTWNTDLAIGTPPPGEPAGSAGEVAGMRQATPATTRVAVEIKNVMTEHRKAVKNRKRDMESHHAHVHQYDPEAVAGGVFVVNAASTFCSPLRATGLTTHRKPKALVEHCINEMINVTASSGASPVGLDAKAVLVVDMDNVNLKATGYVTTAPAPPLGSPLHWDAFVQRLCDLYGRRFSS